MPEPGKFGRVPFDPEVKHLVLEKYLNPRAKMCRSGLPPVAWTEDVDRSSRVSSIPMYLNDQIGDCTIAGIAHLYGAVSVYGGHPEVMFEDGEIQSVYSRVSGYVPGNANTDNGALCSTVLADNKANGISDTAGIVHKNLGYAKLGNPADEELVAQCLDVFGSLYVGFNVQSHMMTEFSDGQVWTWQNGDSLDGGHCVVLQRRYPCGSMHGVLEYYSWGQRQRADFGWQANAVEEAWVVVTPEWITANGATVEGMDLQQLLADMADV